MKKNDIFKSLFLKQTIGITIILLVLLTGRLIAQPIIEYTPENFHTFVDDLIVAEAGTVFILTESGAEYLVDGFPNVDVPITFKAADGLAEKPIVRNMRDQNWTHMMRIRSGGSLVMKGIEFDGHYPGTPGTVWAVRTDDPVIGNYHLVVEDCVFRNFNQHGFRAAGDTHADSIVFRNSVFDNITQHAVYFWETSQRPKTDMLEITNCTFSNIGRSIVNFPETDGSTHGDAYISHITTYQTGNSGEGWPLIDLKKFQSFSFKNSIVTYAETDTLFFIEDDAIVAHNNFYGITDEEVAALDTLVWFYNPGFEDPMAGNFTVNNAHLYVKSEDEGLLGDSRWALDETPNTYYYAAHQASEMQSHFTSAQDGDVFILTDGGSRYVLDGFPNVNAKITIKAQEGLAERPILNNKRDQGSTPMLRIHTGGSLILKDLVFDGIWVNEAEEEITTAFAIRVHGGIDDYHLIAENCHFKDFSENAVRVDANTHADSIVFNNCIFENISGREGFRFSNWPAADPVPTFDLLQVTNSTFANINREAIKIPVADDPTSGPVIIDQVTIDNAGSGTFGILRLLAVESISITNSIFTNSVADVAFLLDDDGVTFDYSNLFNLTDDADYGGDNMLAVDPMYADADNNDYTLGNSELYTAGDLGQVIGDPRWLPVVATTTEQTATNADGQYFLAQSNKAPGHLFIIHEDLPQDSVSDFNDAIAEGKGASAPVTEANTDMEISTSGLEPGQYNLYAVDSDNNISPAVEDLLTVTDALIEVSAEPQTVTNAEGEMVFAQSSKAPATLYIILQDEPQSTVEEFNAAVAELKGASAPVVAPGILVAISTAGLYPGIYNVYAVDDIGNISEPIEGVITVNPKPVVVTAAAQTATNAEGQFVVVQSNYPDGMVYIIKLGEPYATQQDLDNAVAANKGASAVVTAADTDIEIFVEGLEQGVYHPFAVNGEGVISEPGENAITIEDATNVDRISAMDIVNLYASNGMLVIDVKKDSWDNSTVEVFNVIGTKMLKQSLRYGRNNLAVSSKGVVIVVVTNGAERFVKKVVVN